MIRLLLPAALGLCLSLSGCGLGAVASGGAVVATGGDSGEEASPGAPRSIVTAAPVASNLVTFQVDLSDPAVAANVMRDGGKVDPRIEIIPEFRIVTTDQWHPMTEASVKASSGTRGLPLGKHDFVWNSLVDVGGSVGFVSIRARARYEDTSPMRRSFRIGEADVLIDNRLAATILGGDADPSTDVRTVPVDMCADVGGLLVAGGGANIVEIVDGAGAVSRVLGLGIPGDSVCDDIGPGVVRLPRLVGLAVDREGNLLTAHGDGIVFTNRGSSEVTCMDRNVPPSRIVRIVDGLSEVRALRIHPGGLALWVDVANGATRIMALNLRSPGGGDLELAGVRVAPAEMAEIAVGVDLEALSSLAIGPDGEIYLGEGARGRVRVLNPGSDPIIVSGEILEGGSIATVAGGNGLGFSGDGEDATSARLGAVGGLRVTPERGLLIADTSNGRVRMVNLGSASLTFAGTHLEPGTIDTVVGGGVGAAGSRANEIRLIEPRALAIDGAGGLLVSSATSVVLVNPEQDSMEAYGSRVVEGRTALVYDAARRSGMPLQGPRAAHLVYPNVRDLLLTDRTTVRVVNLGPLPVTYGPVSVLPGETGVLGGGATPGFSGDGGPARSAEFAQPSALASFPAVDRKGFLPLLFVADTGNDRVRVLNLAPPGTEDGLTAFGVEVSPAAVETVVGGGDEGQPGDGDHGPALDASLSSPGGIAALRYAGVDLLFVADTGHHRIRVVNGGPGDVTLVGTLVREGSIATIMGSGLPGYVGDGPGPWMTHSPSALVAYDAWLFFAEPGNARIRILNIGENTRRLAGIEVPPGETRTLVGTGTPGWNGEGDLGPRVEVDQVRGMFLQTRGGVPHVLYFSDHAQNLVRVLNLTDDDIDVAVGADGKPTARVPGGAVITIAGGPNRAGFPNAPAFGGDGSIALEARFSGPFGVVWTAEKLSPAHFLTADEGNDRLRRFGAPPTRGSFVGP